MRILITTGLFPPDIGGPATQIEYLATDLARAGFEIMVLTYGAPEKKARLFKLYCVSKGWPAPFRHLFFALKTLYLSRQADIIYTTDLYSPGFYSMLAAKFWRKKLVVRFAGDSAWEIASNERLIEDDILSFQEKKYSSAIEKLKDRRTKILKSAEAVVAVSNFMKELAIKIGVAPEKIHLIYNAVDFLGQFPGRVKPPRPVLVTACRLTPWKGVAMLVEVVAKLKEKYPEIIFEILGDGSELPRLKRQVDQLSIKQHIRFRGRVSEAETLSVFAHSTIFVLNTNYEGLSHAILEALAVDIPVITTPSGGNPELVQNGENGLLVPYDDQSAWEQAIARLLDDEALQEKFVINGKKTLEKFKWSELLQKTIEVFRNLTHPSPLLR